MSDRLGSPQQPRARFKQLAPALLHLGRRFLLIVIGDEVAEHLGVGLGLEGITLAGEEFLDAGVVLNDAVVDQGDFLAKAREVRLAHDATCTCKYPHYEQSKLLLERSVASFFAGPLLLIIPKTSQQLVFHHQK